jgi:ketosteroid isomerase-like protein
MERSVTTVATDLLHRHLETLVADPASWEALIADDVLWELPYAPSIGHPGQLEGREAVLRHAAWFRNAVENFRFLDLRLQALADPEAALAEVRAGAIIKSTGRLYQQDYVVLLRSRGGQIIGLREYFNPIHAAQAMEADVRA